MEKLSSFVSPGELFSWNADASDANVDDTEPYLYRHPSGLCGPQLSNHEMEEPLKKIKEYVHGIQTTLEKA